MITNADITLYNYHVSSQKRCEEFVPTLIRGVHWYTDQKVTVQDGVIQSADLYKIRIPVSADTEHKEYIDPEKFVTLPDDEAKKYWTIENGDLFVKGIIDKSYSDIANDSALQVGKVKSWSDNRRGSAPHFRIGGA